MKGIIIYNPTAGPRDVKRELKRVRRVLGRHGWSVDIERTDHPDDVLRLTQHAVTMGLDAVWVAGGDGTISGTIDGLIGSQTALAILPVGTGNFWARQLHLPVYTFTNPFRLREAAISQAEGRIHAIDVGRMNGRHFLLWSGIGFDAQVTADMEPRDRITKQLGPLPYIIAAATLARDFSGVRTRVELDGRTIRGRVLLILVSNIQMYAFSQIARQARLDDGLLDVFVFKGLGFVYTLRHAIKIFSGRHLEDPRIVHRQAQKVVIRTDDPLAVQADGDPMGTTPVTLDVVPQALRILVPSTAPATLFSKEA